MMTSTPADGTPPDGTPPADRRLPVFLDESGRRWQRVRLAIRALAVFSTLAAVVVVIVALVAPNLAGLGDVLIPTRPALKRAPTAALTRRQREQQASRHRLLAALARNLVVPARRPALITVNPKDRRAGKPAASPADPVVVGFYVKWDDNSRTSLIRNVRDLDWVVGEFASIAPGGDSLRFDLLDKRVFDIVKTVPPAERPRVLLMLTNADRGVFDPARVGALVNSPAHRARAVRQLAAIVRQYGFAGVTLDLENFPERDDAGILALARELRTALAPLGAILTQTISTDVEPPRAGRFAAQSDYVFLMLYDEHYRTSDPGPVASQGWFDQFAADYLRHIPARKAIFALGAYGYAWNDADTDVPNRTYQDVVTTARENETPIRFDSVSLNPYLAWTDPDSTDHVIWFLDATTAYNEALSARHFGAAGIAVWRLGSEDPSLWNVLSQSGVHADPAPLDTMRVGYDVTFAGTGEVLRIIATPTKGRRTITRDPRSGLITGVRTDTLPTPYIVRKVGGSANPTGQGGRKIALTFDDGPDGQWTPPILDTLRARKAPATFFMLGQNIQSHLALTRRVFREGHEIGNHTFTHPNLALTRPFLTRLELDATERIIEAVLNRRTALFRPPYFGDATPSTPEELLPVSMASELGFITVGLNIDSEDWDVQHQTTESILRNVLDARDAQPDAHVVLLHDSGGDRARTVAALGPIIDSLRARGDTLVLVSELVGASRDVAMPALPASSAGLRLFELAVFGSVGVLEVALYYVLLTAVVLGMARLAFVTSLAAVQRWRSHRREKRLDAEAAAGHPSPGHTYAPSVSVIVPAYNEEKVIIKTIASLLAQEYAGDLEIVVVDDGSPDDTYTIASHAYGAHPQVAVYTKPNGGKASALNFGIERARGEVVIGLDADTVFEPRTVAELVAPLADPTVGAVAGNAKVGNRINIITQWQAVEYVASQNLDRRAFSLLDCITVVPGAVGAWRKALVLEVGGFSEDTLAEDQDLTLSIRRRGHSIAYADAAIAWTEAPDTVRGLAKQRFRWSFGTLQCMWKHRDALANPRYGTLGFVAMPNVWLFQLVFAALSPLADLLFVYSLISVWLMRMQHGDTYALQNLEQVLTYYAVFLIVDWLAAVIAFLMEPGEDRRLTWLVFLQRFAYRQLMYLVVLRSLVAALRGGLVGWGKLERKATVDLRAA